MIDKKKIVFQYPACGTSGFIPAGTVPDAFSFAFLNRAFVICKKTVKQFLFVIPDNGE